METQGERGPVAAGGMSVPAISKPGARILNTGAAPSFDPASFDVRARDLQLNDPRGEDGVIKCWTVRGCTGLWGPTGNYMELDCPHNVPDRYSPCPGTCAFTHCQRPWHEDATSLDDLLDPDVDRLAAIKEECRHCLHFIRRGPRAHAHQEGTAC